MKVRMREAVPTSNGNGHHAQPVQIPPVRAVGVIVRKQDLVSTLGALIPGLVDIQVDEGGETFFMFFGGEAGDAGQAEEQ